MLVRLTTNFALTLILLAVFAGCQRGPKMVPISGKVIYNGQPLTFGSVIFQPMSGQPAQGDIQSDGTFTLSTYRLKDGAVVGSHKVRIVCYESQKPKRPKIDGRTDARETADPGEVHTFDQSGFTADVAKTEVNHSFLS